MKRYILVAVFSLVSFARLDSGVGDAAVRDYEARVKQQAAESKEQTAQIDQERRDREQREQQAQLESTLRETQRLARGARAQAAAAQAEVNKLATQPIEVPGEPPEERDLRHAAICRQIYDTAVAAYTEKHPFLPSGWKPHIDEATYAQALRRSDEQTLAAVQGYALAQIAALDARVATIERDLAAARKRQTPKIQQSSSSAPNAR
jgi:hypothetical protein